MEKSWKKIAKTFNVYKENILVLYYVVYCHWKYNRTYLIFENLSNNDKERNTKKYTLIKLCID